jgi:two-component system NtrC family response regulator
MATEIRRLRRLARAGREILLSGETGVGKEVYAKAVHRASGRSGRFVALNCAAIPTDLVESELFGFVRGAHSQAAANKPGLIEEAEHGTLFLDEIGDMPGPAQAKLLRFLQEHTYVPLGSREIRRMDVRVIGATSSLTPSAQAHGLRQDLRGRFGAEPVVLPPLRERREDLGALVSHFLGRESGQSRPLETGAFLALCLHDWPQNVRELENVIREAVLYSAGRPEIRLVDLPRVVRERVEVDKNKPAARRRSPRARPDKAEIEALLDRHKGNVAEVARELDRQWAVVWRWILKSGLDVDKYRR